MDPQNESYDSYLKYDKSCSELWGKTCFTNFQMLDFLRDLSKRTWKSLIVNPSFAKGLIEKIREMPDREERLRHLWEEDMGLCTSWCIAVVQKMNDSKMNYGDQGNHRAAYRDDGIVIDSSARNALLIPKDKSMSVGNRKWSMEEISTPNAKLFSVSSLLQLLMIKNLNV